MTCLHTFVQLLRSARPGHDFRYVDLSCIENFDESLEGTAVYMLACTNPDTTYTDSMIISSLLSLASQKTKITNIETKNDAVFVVVKDLVVTKQVSLVCVHASMHRLIMNTFDIT